MLDRPDRGGSAGLMELLSDRKPIPTVLIVSEGESESSRLASLIKAQGWVAIHVHSREAAINVLDRTPVDALITRLRARRIRGLNVLALARERNPDIGAILIINPGEEEQAVRAMRGSVVDFQSRPLIPEKAMAVLLRVLERQRLTAEVSRAEQRLELKYSFAGVIGGSGSMVGMLARLKEIAPIDAGVLLMGEPGTGKNLIARVIHQHSPRRNRPFVTLQCAGLSKQLLRRELFGASAGKRGVRRPGRLEIANGGTFCLIDVEKLPVELQAQVAVVLQTGQLRPEFRRELLDLDVRLTASSTVDLDGLVGEGQFHEGLYELLSAARITLPPLRHRRRDIPVLVRHFLEEFAAGHRAPPSIEPEALSRLESYSWPGNVRELRNALRELLAARPTRELVEVGDLPANIREARTHEGSIILAPGTSLQEAEGLLIAETLRMAGGNREKAAEVLGISVRTLYRKLKRYPSHT